MGVPCLDTLVLRGLLGVGKFLGYTDSVHGIKASRSYWARPVLKSDKSGPSMILHLNSLLVCSCLADWNLCTVDFGLE